MGRLNWAVMLVFALALGAADLRFAQPVAQPRAEVEATPARQVVFEVATEPVPTDAESRADVPTPTTVIAGLALLGIVLSRRRRTA